MSSPEALQYQAEHAEPSQAQLLHDLLRVQATNEEIKRINNKFATIGTVHVVEGDIRVTRFTDADGVDRYVVERPHSQHAA